MQKITTLIIFIFFAISVLAQNSISGNILDENGEPAIGTTITIK